MIGTTNMATVSRNVITAPNAGEVRLTSSGIWSRWASSTGWGFGLKKNKGGASNAVL